MKKKNYYKCLKRNKPSGVLPYKRLLGMCRWMGSHFHDWSDYNGVIFGVRKFSLHIYGYQTYQNVCTVGEK